MGKAEPELRHDRLVSMLYNTPPPLGFANEDLICKSLEFAMYSKGRKYVTPDLYFMTNNGKQGCFRFYEVKSTSSSKLIDKARSQIWRVKDWVRVRGIEDTKGFIVFPKKDRYSNFEDILEDLQVERIF